MTATPRPNRMNIDLQQYKQPWLNYCKANRTTPSEAFRQVVAKLTGESTIPLSSIESNVSGKVRKEIKLTSEEVAAVAAAASHDGFQSGRWIVALIRARLDKGAQLGQGELEALSRSNMQLLALGRNVNQIARLLHANPGVTTESKLAELDRVSHVVKDHVTVVSRVLEANINRWSAK